MHYQINGGFTTSELRVLDMATGEQREFIDDAVRFLVYEPPQ
jgi:hypothetical protein